MINENQYSISPPNLPDDLKTSIIHDLNFKIGSDIKDFSNANEIENELMVRRKRLEKRLQDVREEVETKLSSAINKAETNSNKIECLKIRSTELQGKVETFLKKTEPLSNELDKRFTAICKLEEVVVYLKSYSKIEELSTQMKQCNDDEQLVLLYGEMKKMCCQYKNGYRGTYIKENIHYWHNILKDNLGKHYEDTLKLLKWPFTSAMEHSPPPKEVMNKFNNLTRYLLLIQEPEDEMVITGSEEYSPDLNPCLPVRILLQPLKKRFAFHFTGSRQTARVDRPEWFLTQTLTWIKDHRAFVETNIQPVADKLQLNSVNAVDEFNAGLVALAGERLHTVLAIYQTQSAKGEMVDVDVAFAHAVDETLGFHKELVAATGSDVNNVLSVLTKAETFVRWLAVEKKYALTKMDEILDNEQWIEPIAAGVGSAVGSVVWVPRGADLFITLLKTIEDRYAVLPQPGHRLQFLELQLDLIEEWRIRLTQLLSAAANKLTPESFLVAGVHPLTAIINAAHHTHSVLLQWAHSLHYLQLHYYKSQFNSFTQQQHKAELQAEADTLANNDEYNAIVTDDEFSEPLSLNEVEYRSKSLALQDMTRSSSQVKSNAYCVNNVENSTVPQSLNVEMGDEGTGSVEEEGAFSEVANLLAHLRSAGVTVLSDHILMEFKATIRDYKKQKWHALPWLEAGSLGMSGPLCGPLAALCARLAAAARALAPRLTHHLRAHLAAHVDNYIYEEVVLENWFNTGGTLQFTHDVERNLLPAFTPPNQKASKLNLLPKLLDACRLLNLDYDDARRLRILLSKHPRKAYADLRQKGINNVEEKEAQRILDQRTDLSDSASPSSVMELF